MPLIGWLFLLIFLGIHEVNAAPTHVVTEERAALRRGPASQQQILQRLARNTPVYLDADNPPRQGFTAIRLEDGRRGWILTRHLAEIPPPPSPPPEPTATAVLCENQAVVDQLQQDNERLRLELAELRRASLQVTEFIERNNELETLTADLERINRVLQQEKQMLQDDSQYRWFLYGAGVLLSGCLLGIWLPNLQFSRSRRWREL